ncbi:MAG: RluA family pseudouridine synthase [Prevotellaceae bacterium]|jgi:23S rRNA pseudouridine1911/1915/1917 synthase|nr:RluA family pseudouridine synthase [Prevotellaceae bacterium]
MDERAKSLEIIYEDNHLIVVNKKVSQIVQGDKTKDISLDLMLKQYIKERDKKPGEVFLGVPHRLDRPVSGAVVFAKTGKALARMNELFKSGEIDKTYFAIVKNAPPEEHDVLTHYITRNEEKNKSYAQTKASPNSKKAVLEYTLVGKSDTYFLLKIKLYTGRHHQIRSQLAAIACPVKGDLKYGAERSNPDKSISLHARSISFVHPVKKTLMEFIAPVPQDSLWQYFESKM